MRIALLLTFIAIPLLEIALLIKAGETFGFWPTLTIIIITALLGTAMLRWQGLSVLTRAKGAIEHGQVPVESVADGAFLLVAGAFLLTPGFFTDALGFALMVPPVRRWLGSKIWRSIMDRADEEKNAPSSAAGPKWRQRNPRDLERDRAGNIVIDADYKDLDP